VDADDLDSALDQAANALRRAERVAVLTGAGVSAESGVATFRGAGGLWEGYRIEDVATPEAFHRDPALVWRFYNLRRAGLRGVRPNPGHHALAALEEQVTRRQAPAPGRQGGGGPFTLVTQNIDGLHHQAGSRRVLELHGNLARVRCTGCARAEDRGGEDLPDLPRCGACGALLRPDVVWFHEFLPEDVWREAAAATAACQSFLVVGTSAVVYPAAGLIGMARGAGATVVEVNPEATAAGAAGAIALRGPSGVLLPRLVQMVSGERGASTPG
jgi:NAD-dependent deacetylase